jgi:hypothetical protein
VVMTAGIAEEKKSSARGYILQQSLYVKSLVLCEHGLDSLIKQNIYSTNTTIIN